MWSLCSEQGGRGHRAQRTLLEDWFPEVICGPQASSNEIKGLFAYLIGLGQGLRRQRRTGAVSSPERKRSIFPRKASYLWSCLCVWAWFPMERATLTPRAAPPCDHNSQPSHSKLRAGKDPDKPPKPSAPPTRVREAWALPRASLGQLAGAAASFQPS